MLLPGDVVLHSSVCIVGRSATCSAACVQLQSPTSIDSAWRDAVEAHQIKNFKFHDLRHCCASYMAPSWHSLNVIAEVLGHRKLDMTPLQPLTTQTKASAMVAALGGIQ